MTAAKQCVVAARYFVDDDGSTEFRYWMLYTSSDGQRLARMTGDFAQAHRFPSKATARIIAREHGLEVIELDPFAEAVKP